MRDQMAQRMGRETCSFPSSSCNSQIISNGRLGEYFLQVVS